MALRDRRAGPRAGGPRSRPVKTALPAADVAGLTAAVAVDGADRVPVLAAVYALACWRCSRPARLHRLPVCLRACGPDEPDPRRGGGRRCRSCCCGRRCARGAGGAGAAAAALVLSARLAVCAALRAAHRRGLLTERAVVVGAGTFGAYIARLMREHPELGLTPAGFVDDGPPRLTCRSRPWAPSGAGRLVTRFGIGRVVVCFCRRLPRRRPGRRAAGLPRRCWPTSA